ncbi:coiled-coil-helix-coiled-coil-helix domain containing 3a isoform X2 [Triplophysa dalaica]|uniref:coiled-coil-helix-coiled-coil-helix domain containing 3a isoform X2 n=1 Tax=Triplophysa dalaica TaxID=1582913 RepID=UPI0024DFDC98|nr:coiled-coil-helix-coiled-coil-helix domain containing 3a isoform X2 [Triplophysa dalaica]
MGANSSTRRVSFESDENENITIVKGIRLSEKVINRMKEPSEPSKTQSPSRTPPSSPPLVDPLPALVPISPLFDPLPPPVPESAKLPPAPPVTKTVSSPAPPTPLAESAGAVLTPAADLVAPVASTSQTFPHPPPTAEEPVASPAVDESELRRKITEELERGLEEERKNAREELTKRLEKERSKAHSVAQAQVKDEVRRILAMEKASAEDNVKNAILRERVSAEDERLRAQIYAGQLEEREKELKNQDAFYREQLSKMKERSAQFYKVTNENYNKAADEVNAKFKRYEISPVCSDLQGEILKCYRENAGKTLQCSNIASLYLQCVNNARQEKLRTGG